MKDSIDINVQVPKSVHILVSLVTIDRNITSTEAAGIIREREWVEAKAYHGGMKIKLTDLGEAEIYRIIGRSITREAL